MIKRLDLCLLITVTLLTACAQNKTPPLTGKPTTITFACMDYQRSLYKPLVEGFQATNPNSADEASGMQRQGNTTTSDGQEMERLAAHADTFVWFVAFRPTDR